MNQIKFVVLPPFVDLCSLRSRSRRLVDHRHLCGKREETQNGSVIFSETEMDFCRWSSKRN